MLRIAMLAPPWIPIPAPAYGGIEEVVRLLCDGLDRAGHDVTLIAAPGSESPGDVEPMLDAPHPDEIERSVHEVDHVSRAFEFIDGEAAAGRPFDVVHDHCGFTALAMADRLGTPLVHTVHGPFDDVTFPFYATHGDKGLVVGISRAQLATAPLPLRDNPVVHNPIAAEEWPFRADPRPDGPLLWIGRMSPVKGPHRAIEVARATGRRLVLAGPVQPGQEAYFAEQVEPHLGEDGIEYVGEADADGKRRLYCDAAALLMPIRWAEPFGLVMTEAMACGTPVIAFREGSVEEVVDDGVTGFVVDDEDGMAAAVGRLGEIDPQSCLDHVCEHFDAEVVARSYTDVYRDAARTWNARIARAMLAGS